MSITCISKELFLLKIPSKSLLTSRLQWNKRNNVLDFKKLGEFSMNLYDEKDWKNSVCIYLKVNVNKGTHSFELISKNMVDRFEFDTPYDLKSAKSKEFTLWFNKLIDTLGQEAGKKSKEHTNFNIAVENLTKQVEKSIGVSPIEEKKEVKPKIEISKDISFSNWLKVMDKDFMELSRNNKMDIVQKIFILHTNMELLGLEVQKEIKELLSSFKEFGFSNSITSNSIETSSLSYFETLKEFAKIEVVSKERLNHSNSTRDDKKTKIVVNANISNLESLALYFSLMNYPQPLWGTIEAKSNLQGNFDILVREYRTD